MRRELTGDAPAALEERPAEALVAELARAGERPRSRAAASVGEAVHARYWRLGDVEDLDEAIEAFDVGGFANRSPADLGLLGSLLRARYDRRGDLDDLDRAIRMYESSLEGATYRPPVLLGLAIVLRDRYRHTRDREDLRRALDAASEATEAADEPPSHVTLGQVLLTLYQRTRDPDDLDAALEHLRTAVEVIPPASPDRDGYLNSYAIALLDRFRLTGDLATCDERSRRCARSSRVRLPPRPTCRATSATTPTRCSPATR